MKHNIHLLFSIVATCARVEIPCALCFSSLLWVAGAAPCWRHSCACVLRQSCLILCDPRDGSPPGSSVHGIILARILEWIAISSSSGSSQLRIKSAFPVTPALRWIPYHWVIRGSPKIVLINNKWLSSQTASVTIHVWHPVIFLKDNKFSIPIK